MPPTALPTPSGSLSSDLQADPILGARGQVKDELTTRIEEQRAKIRALELAVEERRRADEVRIQERLRETESIKQELRQRWQFYEGSGDLDYGVLPGTFFAAVFAMPILKWDATQVAQDNFWVY
jgi:TolA-binding protein